MLEVVKVIDKVKHPSGQATKRVLYKCHCGNQIIRYLIPNKKLSKKDCGCSHSRTWKYGKELRKRWSGIKTRTCNGYDNPNRKRKPNSPYLNVEVCQEWKESFNSFYTWSIANGFLPHLHIDRIDPKKGYEPNNCRWVTQQENNRNGARSKLDEHKVKEILLLYGVYNNLDIARIYDLSPSTVANIGKGTIWNDMFSKYKTNKNKVRNHPTLLLPIIKEIKPGSIDFSNEIEVNNILAGSLSVKEGNNLRLKDLSNEYKLYTQIDLSSNNLRNFFNLLYAFIKNDVSFTLKLIHIFKSDIDKHKEVRELFKIFVTDDIKNNFVKRLYKTKKIILKKK